MCDTNLEKRWGSTEKAKLSITKYVQLKTKGGFKEGGEKNKLNSCHIRAVFSRRSLGVKEKCRSPRCVQYDHKHLRSNAVVSPVNAVGSQRTPTDDALFEHALKKHSDVAVWSPYDRHSHAIRSPSTQLELRVRTQRSLSKRPSHP